VLGFIPNFLACSSGGGGRFTRRLASSYVLDMFCLSNKPAFVIFAPCCLAFATLQAPQDGVGAHNLSHSVVHEFLGALRDGSHQAAAPRRFGTLIELFEQWPLGTYVGIILTLILTLILIRTVWNVQHRRSSLEVDLA
jgi:hypothetical protein